MGRSRSPYVTIRERTRGSHDARIGLLANVAAAARRLGHRSRRYVEELRFPGGSEPRPMSGGESWMTGSSRMTEVRRRG